MLANEVESKREGTKTARGTREGYLAAPGRERREETTGVGEYCERQGRWQDLE